MKKIIAAVLVILLLGVLLATSCASSQPTTKTGANTTVPAITQPQTTVSSTYRPAPTTSFSSSPPVITITSVPAPTITITQPAPTTITIPQAAAGGTYPEAGLSGGYYGNAEDNLGLAVGGAKDINNFRDNIRNNYLPLPTDITYEGLFYDYYFETGQSEPATKLFSPSYSYAVTRDPLSNRAEYYLSVGLNSGLTESDFQRKKLNLVIVLDTSGSMNEDYNRYYYDRAGQLKDIYEEEGISGAKKIDSAVQAVTTILDQLNSNDRFAVVQFNSNALLVKSMGTVGTTNMISLKNKLYDIIAGGSTNLGAGLDMALQQYGNTYEMDTYDYENRIIVITDAQPNTGDYSGSGLMSQVENNAARNIYTTFIGVGVDFNTQLTELITKTKGANYYAVHSPREFKERMEQEFDYMVTPLVFDLTLSFQSKGWEIEKVFGSPEADESTGELMRVNTMFPSESEGGQTKGGIILLKLRKTSSGTGENVYLRANYQDRNGQWDSSESVINLETTQPEYFDNNGIRKGILLARYACLVKNWLTDERQHLQYSYPWNPCIDNDTGIIVPPEIGLNEWERQSMPLTVSSAYGQIFSRFAGYFENEMRAVDDFTLDQELGILNKLAY